MPLKSIEFLSLTVMSKPSDYMLSSLPSTWFLSFSLSLFKWLFPDFLCFLSLQVLCHQCPTCKTSGSIGTVVILSFKNEANILFCHFYRQNWISCGALSRVPLEAWFLFKSNWTGHEHEWTKSNQIQYNTAGEASLAKRWISYALDD